MRLLVTGGSSYLGRHLVPLAVQAGHTLAFTYWQNQPDLPGDAIQLDLRDGAQVRQTVRSWQPDGVIHLAGSNRTTDLAGLIIDGTTNLVHALDPACRLINFSTDVVFAGDAAPYKEEDPPAPRHEYGRCKVSAEARAETHANQVTVRTSLIFGLRIPDRGLEGFQQRLAAGETLTLFNNQWRNPIWADALAHACLELLNLPYRGLLHVAGAEAVDRASYSQALLAHWGIAAPDQIQIGADQTGQYPLDTRLDISQAQRLLKTPLPGFFDVLARHNPSPK